jgi:hypothetical protein
MQLVIFLPTFNAPCMCLKIRCDGWKRKYFGFVWQLNRAHVRIDQAGSAAMHRARRLAVS